MTVPEKAWTGWRGFSSWESYFRDAIGREWPLTGCQINYPREKLWPCHSATQKLFVISRYQESEVTGSSPGTVVRWLLTSADLVHLSPR